MVALQFVETLSTGIDGYDRGLADLQVISSQNGNVLAAVTGSGGGIVTYSIGDTGTQLADVTHITANGQAGQRPQLLDLGGDQIMVIGANGNSVTQISLDPAGEILSARTQSGISGAMHATEAALLAATTLVMAGPNQTNATAYVLSDDNTLLNGVTLSDTGNTYADEIGALAVGVGAASNILVVGSQSEYGLTAYVANNGTFTAAGRIGPEDGLGIMVPTDIAMLAIDGQNFAVVSSAAGDIGTAGALSVLAVGVNGALMPTDHVLDTRGSRFGTAQCVDAVDIDGRGFVVAGGGDHGLSLFTLTPEGQLIHLQSIADTGSMGLGGATDIELVVNGDRLEIFVITKADAGIAHFLVDIGNLGDTVQALDTGQTLHGSSGENLMIGGAGRDNLSGGASDDILIDGADDDRLTGNGGANLFVFVRDGTRDTITDFDPAADRIDLSAWEYLYDTTQLIIEERGGHTRITYRDERLDVVAQDGGLVDPEALRAAIVLDVNRSYAPPALEAYATSGADNLSGTWGADTISGRGGNDTIHGLQGDDRLNGGGGEDTLILNTQSNAVMIVDLGGGAFEIYSSEGVDYARAFEFYEFRNETLSMHQMQALAVPDPGTLGFVTAGTSGDDDLRGDEFNDTLLGESGNDVLNGKNGNDSLSGGSGNDTLSGKDGNDFLAGGLDDDRLSGGAGDDILAGGTGRNRLFGQSGDDSLHGGDQRDILNGGAGADVASGDAGNDRLVGGRGPDQLSGDAGPDKLYGNADNDLLEGGADDDLLNGGGGDDTLVGGTGDDYLKGGDGVDVFVYALGDAEDRIVDFDPNEDILMFGEEILNPYASAQDLVEDLARTAGPNVIFDFDGNDRLILSDLSDLSGLADAIHFE